MMVRTEGILTQLIFDHALRIRMKAETSSSPDASLSSSATPETQSILEASTDESEVGSSSGDETLRESNSTASSNTSTLHKIKQKKPKATTTLQEPEKEKKDNLIGKINNLVTTDLGNLIDGRDFLFLSESAGHLTSQFKVNYELELSFV